MAEYYSLTKKEAEELLKTKKGQYAVLDVCMFDLTDIGLVQKELRLFNDEERTDLAMLIDIEDY